MVQQAKIPLVSTKDSRQPYLHNISSGAYAYNYRGPKLQNGVVNTSSTGEITVSPRYGIRNYAGDLGVNISCVFKGRVGSYYDNDRLFVVDSAGDLYEYTTSATSWGSKTPTAFTGAGGTGAVSIAQADATSIAIKGSRNLKFWNGTITAPVTDPDYPAYTIEGLVVMDGYHFVATMDGKIHNSNLDDGTAWTSTDFITASLDTDRAVWLGKHHNHLVLLKEKSIEFFYNVGNPGGSPLAPRRDVAHTNVGCLRPALQTSQLEYYWAKPVAQLGEVIYFLGVKGGGGIGLYKIDNFRLEKISDERLDRELTYIFSSAATTMSSQAVPIVGAFYVGEKPYIQITSGYNFHRYAILYDLTTGIVTDLTSNDPDFTGNNTYELSVGWGFVDTQYANSGTGVYPNEGHTTAFTATGYMVDLLPHVHKDMDNASGSSAYDIDLEIITPVFDGETPNYKFIHSLEVRGDYVDGETASISWTDDDYQTFSTARTVSVADRTKLTRLGKTSRRAFKFQYGAQDFYRVRDMTVTFSLGGV